LSESKYTRVCMMHCTDSDSLSPGPPYCCIPIAARFSLLLRIEAIHIYGQLAPYSHLLARQAASTTFPDKNCQLCRCHVGSWKMYYLTLLNPFLDPLQRLPMPHTSTFRISPLRTSDHQYVGYHCQCQISPESHPHATLPNLARSTASG
jgi:hypothetical protein